MAATVLRPMVGPHAAHRTAHHLPTLDAAGAARLTTEQLMELAAETSRQMASLAGRLVQLTAELDRRQGWRTEGATSLESWMVERCGVSVPTARAMAHVGERLFDLPVTAAALSDGEISFDKVRAMVDVATPETDAELCERAKTCSVAQLLQVSHAARGTSQARADKDYQGRSLRFNDTFRTVTAQRLCRGPFGAGERGEADPLRRRDPLGPTRVRRPGRSPPPSRARWCRRTLRRGGPRTAGCAQ